MALEIGGDAKRPRLPAAAVDHLSALPEPLQLRILSFLPLRSAILASSLSRAWRGLWARRWEDDGNPSPSLHHHLRPHSTPSSNKLLEALELRQFQGRRGRIDRYSLVVDTLAMRARGLDRYYLVVDTLAMRARGLDRYLAAAVRCGVELRRTRPADTPLLFHFPAGAGPALARLSLRGIGVSGLQGRAARPCAALEAVLLHSVRLDDRDLARMLALCPRLRVLGLCSCTGISRVVVMAVMGLTSLRSVTIVDCTCLIGVDFTVVSSLRSFRYSGGCFFYLPGDALFADIDIRFGVKKSRNVLICQKVFSE
ncbi:hypothetical protein CFC21_111757 [Triticum aestivum]|uniref:F-box domain-containing protein n=2 Tax=Triticum aestivum TaxID=4565 RepID=A0A9R1NFF4_WHEAT|nr:uncharacterized protein LOC123168826 [Triticum aestivum]XP_044442628.1 uncharacterized protein LOC123168826 [Triticum aestivum]KAF7111791.1 hypothetical protein CFC21_111757 [Triticum aestivum]